VPVFKFFEKKINFFGKKKLKKKKINFFGKKKLKKKKIHGLTRVLYGHGVNSNLTEMIKLNLFRKLGYQIEHS